MPRNRSEKNPLPVPVLKGEPHWIMEPLRLDAMAGDDLDQSMGAGDVPYVGWPEYRQHAYDDIDEDDKKECYDKWVAYYARYPEKRGT